MTDKTTERSELRVMLARIALATEVPTPEDITFYPDHGNLWLKFDSLAAGLAWSAFLGGETETYLNSDDRRYLRAGVITWHGWQVSLHAWELVNPAEAPLSAETTERLTALTHA